MPIRIWEPARYADEFATRAGSGSGLDIYDPASAIPINGADAPAPYGGADTLVREIAYFTGWAKQYYADTGEFEITVAPGQLQAGDVQRGYLVDIDGVTYVIETYEWVRDGSGYACTISGRDLGKFLDGAYPSDNPGYINADYKNLWGAHPPAYSEDASIDGLITWASYFFTGGWCMPVTFGYRHPITMAGWYRDARRNSGGWVKSDFEDASVETQRAGNYTASEMMPWGACLRYFCNWWNIGYRWKVTPAANNIHTVALEFYNRSSTPIVFNSNSRGVSDFRYQYDSRNAVNAVFASGVSQWGAIYNGRGEVVTGYAPGAESVMNAFIEDRSGFTSYADYANNYSMAFVDASNVPDDIDTVENGYRKSYQYIESKGMDAFESPTSSVSFTYDNSGIYKYGEHFQLGSNLAIADDFLNLGDIQRLTGVQANYEAGSVVKYDLEFNGGRVTSTDKLLGKFSRVDQAAYSHRAKQE